VSSLRTAEPTFRRLVDAVAAFERLPRWSYKGEDYSAGELLEGLILTESSGNPLARRYEPAQDAPGRADAASDPDRPAVDDGLVEDDASYGLCQVMGYVLKGLLKVDRPVRLDYGLLYRPLFGLAAGIEVLQGELRAVYLAHPAEDDSVRVVRALARYNGGPSGDALVPFPAKDGHPPVTDLRRREYVDLVAANAKRARDDRRACAWKAA
jgi:hypothetical protein